MQDYLTQKRARTQADIQTWLRDRPWDTHPVTAAQAAAQNLVFDAATGRIGTDGCFNAGTVLELPSSVDGVRVRALASYAMVSIRIWTRSSSRTASRRSSPMHFMIRCTCAVPICRAVSPSSRRGCFRAASA